MVLRLMRFKYFTEYKKVVAPSQAGYSEPEMGGEVSTSRPNRHARKGELTRAARRWQTDRAEGGEDAGGGQPGRKLLRTGELRANSRNRDPNIGWYM
jgi:hypothetical protein